MKSYTNSFETIDRVRSDIPQNSLPRPILHHHFLVPIGALDSNTIYMHVTLWDRQNINLNFALLRNYQGFSYFFVYVKRKYYRPDFKLSFSFLNSRRIVKEAFLTRIDSKSFTTV